MLFGTWSQAHASDPSDYMETRLKPVLHIFVRVAEHACDDASKRILKLSTYRLKIFLVKYQNLRPLQRFRVQTLSVQLKIHVRDYVLAILTTYVETLTSKSYVKRTC